MTMITRFAPSPTGYLHIGNVRTALFNYLLSKHHGGQFLLRIEDTDRKRHNEDAVRVILDGLKWLGLDHDGEAISQFARKDRHAEVALEMVERGNAYKCYLNAEDVTTLKEALKSEGKPFASPYRDASTAPETDNTDYVVRLKANHEGETTITDLVQGDVTVANAQIDDLVLLRSDGTPTYMLSVVVDDKDMNITHVIRGDDHLTNSFRQAQIYAAMGWDIPIFAHLPMILGGDGGKLSKRHGALGLHEYIDMGYLPEALNNYLMRLGWGHGDAEIISMKQAIEWFDFDGINKSAGRFDTKKLNNLNAHYIQHSNGDHLLKHLVPFIEKTLETSLNDLQMETLNRALPVIRERGETLIEIAEQACLFLQDTVTMDEKASNVLDDDGCAMIARIKDMVEAVESYDAETLEKTIKDFITNNDLKFKHVGMPARAALVGTVSAPPVHDIMFALGREETLARLNAVIK